MRISTRFLLPVLQMQFVLEAMTRSEIQKSLRNLSANLGQAFEDTLRRIDNEPRNRRQVAIQSLSWVSHACRPLLINELRHALATQVGDTAFDPDNLLQSKLIVECCSGLIVIDDKSSLIRLVHHTLQDFLHSKRQEVFRAEETEITKFCLIHLCLGGLDIAIPDQRGASPMTSR